MIYVHLLRAFVVEGATMYIAEDRLGEIESISVGLSTEKNHLRFVFKA